MEFGKHSVSCLCTFIILLLVNFSTLGKSAQVLDDFPRTSSSDFPTIVQFRPKSLIVLNALGTAFVLPGTALVLVCPFKKQSRDNVVWKKNGKLLRDASEKIVRSNDTLTTDNRDLFLALLPDPTSEYVCIVGDRSSRIKLRLHSPDAAEKLYSERSRLLASNRNPRRRRDVLEGDNNIASNVILQSTEGTSKKEKQALTGFWDDYYDYSHVPYQFVMTEWGACSTSECEGVGVQRRNMSCEVVYDWYFRRMEEEMCVHHGVKKPEDERKCNEAVQAECPEWKVGEWAECSTDHCVTNGKAYSERSVQCSLQGQTLADGKCTSTPKPDTRRPCDHSGCKAEWTTGVWSGCSRSCGGEGVRLRLIQCRWKHNESLAYVSHCDKEQPRSVMTCAMPPCDQEECKDHNNYCSLAIRLNMCRFTHFRQRCCTSCKGYVPPPPAQPARTTSRTTPRVNPRARLTTSFPTPPVRRNAPTSNRVSALSRFSNRNYRQFSRNLGIRRRFVQPQSRFLRNDVRFQRIRF